MATIKVKMGDYSNITRRKQMIEEEKNNRTKTIFFKVIQTLEEPVYMEVPEDLKEEDYEDYIQSHMEDVEIPYGWDEVINVEYKPDSIRQKDERIDVDV